MTQGPWPRKLAIGLLFAASVMLAGCPKRPAPAVATGPGTSVEPAVREAAGSGPSGGGGPSPSIGGGSGAPGGGPTASGRDAPAGAGGPDPARGETETRGPTAPGTTPTPSTSPTIPAPPLKGFAEVSALREIHFDFDRHAIRPKDVRALEENARWLRANPNTLLLIEGHADERGTDEYNLALAERRARAARDRLVTLGVGGSRILIVSYGEERPVCPKRTEACRARNRRARFLVKQ